MILRRRLRRFCAGLGAVGLAGFVIAALLAGSPHRPAMMVAACGALIWCAGIAILTFWVERMILSPLGAMSRQADAISRGQAMVEIACLPDELGHLQAGLHRIRRSLSLAARMLEVDERIAR